MAINAITYAQDFELRGIVSDSLSNSLPGAAVALLQPLDSVIISGATTDENGNFIFRNIPRGKYLIRITYLGFTDLFLKKEIIDQSINLGSLVMKEKTSTLKEVNVTEKIPPVQMKGDTTQYNADAFKTNRDATAEDLTLKMPGITTTDGKVQAQGEEVKKVLIDGKPFLGDDANAALKNLPAEVVEKIQIFDKKSDQSEFTGFDDGNTTKTINIVTRPQFRNGVFGRAYGGYGTDDRWKGGLSINSFKDKRKFTILGNTNNINDQNFSTDDLLGVVGTNAGNRQGGRGPGGGQGGPRPQGGGSGGRYQPQNDAGNFLVDQKNGISTTYSAGINYANTIKKADITFSYFFNRSENISYSETFRQYFTSDNAGYDYQEKNSGKSENTNHRANLRLEYKFDSLNSILFQPRVSIQNNIGISAVVGDNSFSNSLLSTAGSNYNSDLDGVLYSIPLLYRHSFNKKGRTISANLIAGYNQNKGNSDLISTTIYYADTIPTDTMDQQSDLNSNSKNYSSEFVYTEPISSKSQLSLSYKGSINKSISDKSTFTFSPSDGSYNTLDTALSNKFTSDYFTQSAGATYRITKEKWNMNIGAAFQSAQLKNEQEFPFEGNINKNFTSVLPNAMFQYKFTPVNNIRLFYRSSNSSPSVTQLQNVINNTNPLQLTSGNPDLGQDWQNSINIRYSSANTSKNTSFFVYMGGSVTQDYIGNSTFVATQDTTLSNGMVLASGSQLISPVNLDGYYSIRAFGNYSFPLGIFKSSLSLNSNINFSRTPALINDALSYSHANGAGLGFAISSNISEKYDFSLSSNGSFNNATSSLDDNSNNRSYNLTNRIKFQVMPWKGLVLQTDFTHQYNWGLSESYNQKYVLWNAAIGYKFLKDKVADIRLSVFDLLKQNTSVVRNTTDTYYEDVRSDVLQQYFMLTFTYNLKFFKVKKEEGQ